MTEEDLKKAVENILMLQNNNDHNFQLLQAQIDNLQKQTNDLNDLKEMFRLPNQRIKIVSISMKLSDFELPNLYNGMMYKVTLILYVKTI